MWIGLEEFEPNDCVTTGFVYRITNIVSGEWYIGSKRFFSKCKGKTVISNWKSYQSSNKVVKAWDKKDIKKECLCICSSLYELTYMEVEHIINTKALLHTKALNSMLGRTMIGRTPAYMQI